jgi:hypothetical protein
MTLSTLTVALGVFVVSTVSASLLVNAGFENARPMVLAAGAFAGGAIGVKKKLS